MTSLMAVKTYGPQLTRRYLASMDFDTYLADLAADGIDISVPVPYRPKYFKASEYPLPDYQPEDEDTDDDKFATRT
jgi:hypothetical protein